MVINRIKDRNMGHQVPHWDLGDLHGSLWGFQEEIGSLFFYCNSPQEFVCTDYMLPDILDTV